MYTGIWQTQCQHEPSLSEFRIEAGLGLRSTWRLSEDARDILTGLGKTPAWNFGLLLPVRVVNANIIQISDVTVRQLPMYSKWDIQCINATACNVLITCLFQINMATAIPHWKKSLKYSCLGQLKAILQTTRRAMVVPASSVHLDNVDN